MLKPATGRCDMSVTSLPAIWNGMPNLTPCSGAPSEAETEVTPGSA